MKKYFIHFLCAAIPLLFAAGCGSKDIPDPEPEPDNTQDTTKVDPVVPPEEVIPTGNEKDMSMWISATINWHRLRNITNIRSFLDKIQGSGLNMVILEVKMMQGGTCYPSKILPQLITYNKTDHNFDYLQVFIDECRSRNMKIGAALTVLPTWDIGEDYKYKDSTFEDKYCQQLTKNGLQDIREDSSKFGFLNPVFPEVRSMVMDLCEEVVTNYDIDALVLDYCRWQDYYSDYSEASHKAFEEYLGESVEDFPSCVLSIDGSGEHYGPYWNQYLEFRSWVIKDYVREIRSRVKSIKPDVSLEYWAGSWANFSTGQNWASPSKNYWSSYWWASPDFYKTGFADQLDVFQNGAYVEKVLPENSSPYINFLSTGTYRLNGECKQYASFSDAGANYDVENFVYYGLKMTDGLMVFELCHTIGNAYWDEITQGIKRAKIDGYAFLPE